MSKYFPTTEEVREQFVECRACYICDGNDAKQVHGVEFNCWLAAMKAEIWAEGFDAGLNEADEHEAHWRWGVSHTCMTNPYREEKE